MSQTDQHETTSPESSFRTLLLGVCAVVLAVLVLAGYDGSRDLARLRAREAQLDTRLRNTEAGIAELRDRVARLRSDPHTLEKVAREELGLSRPGEIVVILPRAENGLAESATISSRP